jgi:hypothetical protein
MNIDGNMFNLRTLLWNSLWNELWNGLFKIPDTGTDTVRKSGKLPETGFIMDFRTDSGTDFVNEI